MRKLIPAEMFNSLDANIFSREKYFFLQKLLIMYVFISTFLIELIFYPSTPWKEKYMQKLNRHKLGKLLI